MQSSYFLSPLLLHLFATIIIILLSNSPAYAHPSSSSSSSSSSSWPTSDLVAFETRFISSLDPHYTHSNTTIKLIGYKKILIPDSDLAEFEDHYFHPNHHEHWKSLEHTYYDHVESTMRVYFPVQGALVEHRGQVVEANAHGELGVLEEEEEVGGWGGCAVLGRKQTEHVTGVEGNVIKDGIIFLAQKNKPHHRHDNVFVYDFGIKEVHDHDHDHDHSHHSGDGDGHNHRDHHDHEKRGEIRKRKASCMTNHGGPNCSDKFNIYSGRCSKRHDVCVDYNGWHTDCKKKNGGLSKYLQFPGSDCDYALGRGHCWNEIM